jgi:hypothetical protein
MCMFICFFSFFFVSFSQLQLSRVSTCDVFDVFDAFYVFLSPRYGCRVIQRFMCLMCLMRFHVFPSPSYGCRVIQRLLEHCQEMQLAPVMDEILRHCLQLIHDQYAHADLMFFLFSSLLFSSLLFSSLLSPCLGCWLISTRLFSLVFFVCFL